MRCGDAWFLVYHPSTWAGDDRQLHYGVSRDLMHWCGNEPLLPGLHEGRSCIDGALAFHDDWLYLGYKLGQRFMVTRAREVSGPWAEPERGNAGGAWGENFQFIRIDGEWRMLATARHPGRQGVGGYTRSHEPFIYRMDGAGDRFEDWTRWVDKRLLEVPQEHWNQVMHANAASLCDWREQDGHFYLFYTGANDDVRFDTRGHGKIGVARSRDLETWEVP